MKKIIITIAILSCVLCHNFYGQESNDLRGQKRAEGHYANLFHFTFKPGKTDEGLEILNKRLLPAFNNAGIHVTLIEDLVGTKDVMALIPLEEGPRFYEYLVPGQDIKLIMELVKLTGSQEKAEEDLDKFINLLTKQSQTLVFIPKLL